MSSMKSRKKIENISILANNKQTNNNKNLITENRKYQKTLITENCDWWCQWLAGLFCFFRYFLVINKYHFSISIINWSSKKCCPFINNVFVCCNVWPPFFQKKKSFWINPSPPPPPTAFNPFPLLIQKLIAFNPVKERKKEKWI